MRAKGSGRGVFFAGGGIACQRKPARGPCVQPCKSVPQLDVVSPDFSNAILLWITVWRLLQSLAKPSCLELYPRLAGCVADVPMVEKFFVGELLGVVYCGSQKAHHGHGTVSRLIEDDVDMPSIGVLADHYFSSTVMDSSEPSRIVHCRGKERRKAWHPNPSIDI